MEKTNSTVLIVDPKFKKLIRPLRRQEFLHLEHSVCSQGCKEPILTWDGIIIDGHNRYEICKKQNIPFAIQEMDFPCEEAVVAWICEHQLKRITLTEEMRRYLIGTQFECEKEINKASRPRHRNQYSSRPEEGSTVSNAYGYKSGHRTATRIAEENHVSYGTVEKYAYFARAVEAIRGKIPELAEKILSGQFKISHNALLDLARMKPEELRILNARLAKKQKSQYSQTRSILQQPPEPIAAPATVSIKDMPAFDPDASANELALTIPTWVGSIERVQNNTDFSIMTPKAKKKLSDALSLLESKALELFIKVQEE